MTRSIRIALVSGGSESLAMVRKCEEEFGEDFFDGKIFADIGRDPSGRATVDYLNKYKNWGIGIVQSIYGDIQDYYANIDVKDKESEELDGHAMPYRAKRDCSKKFKIQPIRNYLRDLFGKKVKFILYYGFTKSKKDIKRKLKLSKPDNRVSYCAYRFPLIDIFKMDRKHCTDLCQKYLGFIPDKSACDMCFENTISDWKKLWLTNKKRALDIMHFEEGSHIFKVFGYGLNQIPLRKIFRYSENQTTLFPEVEAAEKDQEFLKEISPGCACMNDGEIFTDDPEEEQEPTNFKVLVPMEIRRR